jgi:two-component system OmpR family sensor kinase
VHQFRHHSLLETLERLLSGPSTDLKQTVSDASEVLAEAFAADKVDVFLHDPSRGSLVAQGVSHQPLSTKQRALGLDVLQIANGGRVVQAFETGQPFASGHLDADAEELRGVREGLGVRSMVAVPLEVGGARRGVVAIASLAREYFSEEDVRFLGVVSRFVGMAVHRAELAEELGRNAQEQGRRAAADELVTTLAHDLRNLLNPVSFRVDLLLRRAAAEDRKVDVDNAERAKAGLRRVTRLIGNLLDVARIDQGFFHLDLRPVELVALARQTSAGVATPDVPIEVRAGEEVVAMIDRERLQQVLENLLANAIKHSPKGSAVVVELLRQPSETGERVRIDVSDQGPGIAPDVAPTLFQRFARGSKSIGLGLGLFLAREIVVAHGGDVSVETAPGKGTRFTLFLPIGRTD